MEMKDRDERSKECGGKLAMQQQAKAVLGESTKLLGNRPLELLDLARHKAFDALSKSKQLEGRYKCTKMLSPTNANANANAHAHAHDTSDVLSELESELNISELMTEHTIDLNSNTSDNVSFEPTEITARSTLYKKDDSNTVRHSLAVQQAARLSVDDILSSSFAVNARNLCRTLRNEQATFMNDSSSIESHRGIESLPRTADMSSVAISHSLRSLSEEFSLNNGDSYYDSGISKEEFAPGEEMQSKLLLDEISWAEEFAAMPAVMISKEAKAKAQQQQQQLQHQKAAEAVNVTQSAPSVDTLLANYSIGQFFQQRSESLHNIVELPAPLRQHKPFALVDAEEAVTPRIENKLYSRALVHNTVTLKKSQHNSKDSGNANDSSCQLSISAIDRILAKVSINANETSDDTALVNEILQHARKTQAKSNEKPASTASKQLFENATTPENVRASQSQDNVNAENKENLDPYGVKHLSLADTLSCTDTSLNASELRQLNRSSGSSKSRSPLGIYPKIVVTDTDHENDADVDEWSNSPVKISQRRKRFSKSPSPSPSKNTSPAEVSPANQSSRVAIAKTPENVALIKTLCSTRLEGAQSPNGNCDFVISPNLTKNASTARNSNNSVSPGTFDCSPNGSSQNYFASSPQLNCSEHDNGNSNNHNHNHNNSNSEQPRLLTADVLGKLSASSASSVTANVASANSNCSCSTLRGGMNAMAARSISRCSNSSEFSHRDGKALPFKVTSLELSWGSTKLRTESRKTMQLKNISNKRLVLRMEIHGPGYQIVNWHSTLLTLQTQECRSIVISFCPTVTGIAVGSLEFHAPQVNQLQNVPYLSISLWAYGGHASILLQQVLKAPAGSPFINIGDFSELSEPLEASFKIFNKGPLPGFALVNVASMGLTMPRLCDRFEVQPSAMILPAGSIVAVRLIFRPKREDLRKIMKYVGNVMTLANMRIFCGDEANRQRMRRLVPRLSSEERKKIESSTLDKLWAKWPGEQEFCEFAKFHERAAVAIDLLSYIRVHEISLTLNNDMLDESKVSSICFSDADETVLFRTVCIPSPTPSNMLEPVEEELLEHTINVNSLEANAQLNGHFSNSNSPIAASADGSWWSVSPRDIVFDFKSERRTEIVALLICNRYRTRQYFEVLCSHKNLLNFTPCNGYVEASGGQVEVRVHAMKEGLPLLKPSENVHLTIHLDNERIIVPVHIPADNYTHNSGSN